jgi:hypothetical protein
MNFKQSIEFVKSCHGKSNEQMLMIYNHFVVMEEEGTWRDRKFYSSSLEAEPFMTLAFGAFIRNAYGFSDRWYFSMKKILELKNGKELLLKHGRENMATYLNCTAEERRAILKYAETSVATRDFAGIRCQLFPSTKKKEEPQNMYKKKYDKLFAKYKKLQESFEKYKKETAENIKTLKKTISILSEMKEEKKRAVK